MKLVAVAGLVLGCDAAYTGPVHRYVVDRIDVPASSAQALAAAGDLDGDGALDNKLGNATAVLATTKDLSQDAASMIASGALASVVEIQADALDDDDSVAVRYIGRDTDAAGVIGGALRGGRFVTSSTGEAIVRLPIFTNADPVALPAERVEVALVADDAGGFEGTIRGAVDEHAARGATLAGLVQMFQTEPERHLVFLRSVDASRDDTLDETELAESVIGVLVAADVAPSHVSLGIAFHLVPCEDGTCALGMPATLCRDRVRDGDETDVDCGGSCQPCADGKACSVAGDCQSAGCDGGACAAATCTDGVRDAFESDVDCGGVCPACSTGRACAAERDCTSGDCSMGVATVGTCL